MGLRLTRTPEQFVEERARLIRAGSVLMPVLMLAVLAVGAFMCWRLPFTLHPLQELNTLKAQYDRLALNQEQARLFCAAVRVGALFFIDLLWGVAVILTAVLWASITIEGRWLQAVKALSKTQREG